MIRRTSETKTKGKNLRIHWLGAILVIGTVFLVTPATQGAQPEPTPVPTQQVAVGFTLASILSRGEIICAVDQDLTGFGYLNPNTGDITGINVDFCQAIATAIFEDSTAAQIFLLADHDPFELLRSGQVDIVISNRASHTLSDDANSELQFGVPIYYDGQTFMVNAESGIDTWQELAGATICTVTDTVSERNLVNEMARREINFDRLPLTTLNEMQQAFLDGRCSVQTGMRSQLEIMRHRTDQADAYVVWEEAFTREAVGPIYRYGDKQWSDIINWTLNGLIFAELHGITSENVDQFLRRTGASGEDAINYRNRVGVDIAHFLDAELGIGGQLGLQNNFMVEVIREVGNYGEILQRHLGENGELPMARTINSLWTDGGLIDTPDWR